MTTKKHLDRLLVRKGLTDWVHIGIPADVRHAFAGKVNHVETTGTGDRREARIVRDRIEFAVKQAIHSVRMTGQRPAQTLDTTDYARRAREAFKVASGSAEVGEWSERDLITMDASDKADTLPQAAQKPYADTWQGREPVGTYTDQFIKEQALADSTSSSMRSALKLFAAWCDAEGLTIPDIDRKVAGRYATAELIPLVRVTAAKRLSTITAYWNWLIAKGHYEGNEPWTNQLPKAKGKQGVAQEKERPFTTEELSKLLYGHSGVTGEALVKQVMLVSVLSGCRIGEVVTLTVAAVQNGAIDLRKSKTAHGVRVIPMSDRLQALIAPLIQGKAMTDSLFDTSGYAKPTDAVCKVIARHRVKVGVDDKADGKRRSLTNAHSLRRSFVQFARDAHHDVETIADVVGHDTGKKSMTFGTYTSGASVEQKLAVVADVALRVPLEA
jgi:site-specific recombinase XerD